MNMQEMAMAITEKLPVTICILNNYYLGMVRQMQQIFYGKRYEITYLGKDLDESGKCAVIDGAEPEYAPDFVKWAESYGAKGIRVRDVSEVRGALEEAAKATDAPVVIEFMVASEEIVLPMVKGGNPISEMILK